MKPAPPNLSFFNKLFESSRWKRRFHKFQCSSNRIRHRVKNSYRFWDLDFIRDRLLRNCVLCIQRIIQQCTSHVLQVQVGHISQCPVDGCWSLSHVSWQFLFFAERASDICKFIGLWFCSKINFLSSKCLKYGSCTIGHEVSRDYLRERFHFSSIYQRNP